MNRWYKICKQENLPVPDIPRNADGTINWIQFTFKCDAKTFSKVFTIICENKTFKDELIDSDPTNI